MSWEPDEQPAYENVAKRKARAAQQARRLEEEGEVLQPAISKGRKIASTFWGQAWNRNLERYEAYEFRLPRGRSGLKNGQVIDLRICEGRVHALVSGTRLHRVTMMIEPLEEERWVKLKKRCAGQIGSMVALLRGELPETVLEAVTSVEAGLFPEPAEIRFDCDCEDYADLCEHAAAAAYGVGARLDEQPGLLFLLRGVEQIELIDQAGDELLAQADDVAVDSQSLGDLGALFGIDLEGPEAES